MRTTAPLTNVVGIPVPAPAWRPTRHDRAALARQAGVLLRELGNDPATVAERLAAAGVRGDPADARGCALAVYLGAVMTADPRVSGIRVFHDRVVVSSPGRVASHRVAVALPAALRAFVTGFDARRYPTLVRERRAARADATPRLPVG